MEQPLSQLGIEIESLHSFAQQEKSNFLLFLVPTFYIQLVHVIIAYFISWDAFMGI